VRILIKTREGNEGSLCLNKEEKDNSPHQEGGGFPESCIIGSKVVQGGVSVIQTKEVDVPSSSEKGGSC